MKNKLFSRSVAMLLCLSLLFTGFAIPASTTTISNSVASSDEFKIDENITKDDDQVVFEKKPISSDDIAISKESMILKYVDSSQFNEAKHTQRLTELEELNTYVFDNVDGTRSVYVMHENVKYVDKNGSIKEKDVSLISKKGGFGTVQNDIELLIPNNPTQGIDIEYSEFAVKLIPQDLTDKISAKQTDNSIVYEKAYGEKTKLIYTPLLSGVKEDIILTEYTSDASYTFILKTDGLNLYKNDSGYYLSKNSKDDPVFYLGEIIVYDAIGKPDIGTMTVQTVTAGEEYLLTVTANDDFLSDPTTVYPVTIDPSITVSENNADNSIIDAPIYQGYPDRNFGTYTYNRLGTPSGNHGIGRTVVKLSGLTSQSAYQTITANQIQNVTFHVRESSGGSAQYINIYPLLPGDINWTETSVTWNNILFWSSYISCGNVMNGAQWTAFNITDIVKAWKIGTFSANDGFIMISNNEAVDKSFCSSEYSSNTSYRPYVVMTYEPTFCGGDSFAEADIISVDTYYTIDSYAQHGLKYFRFVVPSTGFYTFESVSTTSGNPYARLYNYALTEIAYNDNGDYDSNFILTYHFVSGITYYFVTGCFDSTPGIYDFRFVETANYGPVNCKSIEIGDKEAILVDSAYEVEYFQYRPSTTGKFCLKISSGIGQPRILCYDSRFSLISSNDISDGNLDCELNINLTSGKVYYFVLGHLGSTVGSYILDFYRSLSIVNYYDSSFATNAQLINGITSANELADFVFFKYYGVKMSMSGAPTQYATIIEDCPNGEGNRCSEEICGAACNFIHHKNVYTIAKQIYDSPREDDHIYVLWTDRSQTYCIQNKNSGCHERYDAALAYVVYSPTIQFLNIDDSGESTPETCMSICLIHEIAHIMGMEDVYNNEGHDVNGSACVMEKYDPYTADDYYESILEEMADPFCDTCDQIMISLAYSSLPISGN